jgi:hypothetical protein
MATPPRQKKINPKMNITMVKKVKALRKKGWYFRRIAKHVGKNVK